MLALVKTLALPPTSPLLIALLGYGALRAGKAWGRKALAIGLLAAWLSSTPGVVEPLSDWYSETPAVADTLQRAQALQGRADAVVLVLGAGVTEGARADGGYELKPLTAERLRRGQWWAHRLQLGLAFSGGRAPSAEPGAPAEATVVAQALAESGQPPLVWADDQSPDTRGNAHFSAEQLRRLGTRHVLLVTHAAHMPRALSHFQREAPEVRVLPAPLARTPGDDWRLTDWFPSAEGVASGRYLAYEILARLAGH